MTEAAVRTGERRPLLVAYGAHILHDGYADVLYLLLPLWRAEFALAYAQVGMMRALYVGALAGFQMPMSFAAERVGSRSVLALGTALAASGFLLAGISSGFGLLVGALVLGGLGSSVQHPLASSLVARAVPRERTRTALATYNFSGDLGKMLLPSALAGLLLWMSWHAAVGVLGSVGLACALAIWHWTPPQGAPAREHEHPLREPAADASQRATPTPKPFLRGGFPWLLSIGVIDSMTRMGFLTFLPFLLTAKGAAVPLLGLALTLVFAGGAAGKLVCGYLGARLGVLPTVVLTEILTALGILALIPLPLEAGLAVLPMVGIVLNGTSSVLYGTVPELVPAHRRERAFGLFYTGSIGGGALSPMVFGLISDQVGIPFMMGLVGSLALLTLPLAWRLRPALRRSAP
ncbi:MAG: MFS transporter [Deltaproteobacteria bacterium]|nr:MFS transporter [Deltaproteobacteria bacterium]